MVDQHLKTADPSIDVNRGYLQHFELFCNATKYQLKDSKLRDLKGGHKVSLMNVSYL